MIGYLTLIVALAANIDVTEDIATSTTWTADNTYNLTKQIYVLPGATLTIEAGTIIASEASANGAGGLCVTNGAQIFVNGERHAPVVMTSSLDDGTWRASANEWGNLTLCGDAFIGFDGTTNSGGFPNNTLTPSASNQANMEGLVETAGDPSLNNYGGGDDDYDAGNLSYLSIRYAGRVLGLSNELNGLSLGAFGESEGAVYGFAFETIDNLDDVGLFQAYVGADFGGVDITVGRFQRNFSAELAASTFGYTYGLTNSTVFDRYDAFVEGVSFGGEAGDASFAIDVVGDDVFDGDSSTVSGRVELGALGFGFIGEELDVWTLDISDEKGFISYTDDNGDWTAVAQGVVFTIEDTFSGYGRVEYDHLDETTFAVGGKCEFRDGVAAIAEYDDRDEGVRFGLRFSF